MNNQAPVPVVSIESGQPTTTSLAVAEFFGKRHDTVLRAIQTIRAELSVDRLRNFAETVIERPNPSGGDPIKSPAYNLTRDGFVMLTMGFTGKKAQDFKWAYIDAFNAMEAELRRKQEDQKALSGLSQALERLLPTPPKEASGMKSKRMVKTLRALAAYWAMIEDMPQARAEAAVCAVGGIQKLDDFDGDNDKFWPMFDFLNRLVVHSDKDTEPATKQQIDAIRYLMDACTQTLYVRRNDAYKPLKEFYGVTPESILTATQGQARRIADAAYTLLNKYEMITSVVIQIKEWAKKMDGPQESDGKKELPIRKRTPGKKRLPGGKRSSQGGPKDAAPRERQP